MSLNDVVRVVITASTRGVSQPGFGLPLILGMAGPLGADRFRLYGSPDAMVSDGFQSTDPEYRAASAVFAQNPQVPKVAVGRRATKPTQQWTITPTPVDGRQYAVTLDGKTASFTSRAGGTAAVIIAGLKTAIDALGLPVTTAAEQSDLKITANTAGAWHQIAGSDPALLSLVQSTADAGVASDLDAIALVDSSWYALVSCFTSAAELAAIAAWVEAHQKLFLASTQDTPVISSATTDVASQFKSAGYARTALIYHPDNGAFADAAWAGNCLPFDPGSETWKFKTLAGVASVPLTDTQAANADNKNCNVYTTMGGRAITSEGIVSAREYIDIIRGIDWLRATMQLDIFQTLANAKKVPFTDPGVALIEKDVRARLSTAVSVGLLAADPAYTVTVPKVKDIPATDKAARKLRNVRFNATVAGAIHSLEIDGQVSV
jgi:hypothetical protein